MSNAVVTGILSICSHDAYMLFDPGSTHSYVSPVFAKLISMNFVGLEDPILVFTLMGETILVD